MDFIYHEQQEAALCAVHCLNSLLQGSYFSAVDLAELATNMDLEERRRMAEQGTDTTEYRNFIQSGSNNMDDSGMFSVQVVSAALQVWSLQLTPFTTADPSFREDPTSGYAYICNMREHWFTIRRLGFQWFNLNSLLAFPELLSNTYLALFLAQLQNQGYCIYLVEGPLPPCTADTQIAAHPVTQAVKPLLLSELADQEPQQQQESGGEDSSSQEDADMAAAVAASLAETRRHEASHGSSGEGRRLGGEEEEDESEEAQLERALQMSLTEQLAGVAGPSPNTSASEQRLERAPRSSVSSDVTASSASSTRGTSADTQTSVVINNPGNSCKIVIENNTEFSSNPDNTANIRNLVAVNIAPHDHANPSLDTACQEARALLEDDHGQDDDDMVGDDEQDYLLLEAVRRSLMEQGR